MAKYDWKIEKKDEDWSDDLYAYFLIHINIKKMAEILNKEFKKDWWFKADFGNDICYLVAENNDFPVRLFFTFEEDGWAKITRHYTDGTSYKDETLGNWHFAKYDIGYSFELIEDNIKDYFNRFEEGKKEKTMKKVITEKRGNTEDEKLALAEFLGIDVEEVEEGYTDHVYEADGEEYWVSDYDTAYDQAVEESEELFDELGLEAVSEGTQEYFLENEEYCSYPWEDDMHESNLSYANDIMNEDDYDYGTRLIQECADEVGLDDEDGGFVVEFVTADGVQYVSDNGKKYTSNINKADRFLTRDDAEEFAEGKECEKLLQSVMEELEDDEIEFEVEFEEDLIDIDDLAEKLADEMDKGYSSMSEWFESIYGRDWASEMKDTLERYLDYKAMAEYCVDEDGIANALARYDGNEHTEKVNGVEYYIYRTN